jgi:hypothetical protein
MKEMTLKAQRARAGAMKANEESETMAGLLKTDGENSSGSLIGTVSNKLSKNCEPWVPDLTILFDESIWHM